MFREIHRMAEDWIQNLLKRLQTGPGKKLARAILELARDANKRKRMGEAGMGRYAGPCGC